MAPLFLIASWLEHLGCRKHLLRFSFPEVIWSSPPSQSPALVYSKEVMERKKMPYICTFAHLLLLNFTFLFYIVFWGKSLSLYNLYKCYYTSAVFNSSIEFNTSIEHIEKNKSKKFFLSMYVNPNGFPSVFCTWGMGIYLKIFKSNI